MPSAPDAARDLEADAARDLDAARNLEADPDARAGRGPQRSPDQRFRVLPSGALAFRLPDTKDGKQVWLDVVRRVKLCPCGHSMIEMHHWRCAARPRAKPEWVQCQCDSKGLFTNPKAKPELPADVEVPSYASVLWRDGAPKRLQPANVLAVRVPGKPKDIEVWIDSAGKARCAHGFTESALTRAHQMRRQRAASLLQDWWRRLGPSERGAVRAALLDSDSQAPPSATDALERAADVWRRRSEGRQEALERPKRKRGRPAPRPCSCRPGGLRREMFGTLQRRKCIPLPSHEEQSAPCAPTKKARSLEAAHPSTAAADAAIAAVVANAEAHAAETSRAILGELTFQRKACGAIG